MIRVVFEESLCCACGGQGLIEEVLGESRPSER